VRDLCRSIRTLIATDTFLDRSEDLEVKVSREELPLLAVRVREATILALEVAMMRSLRLRNLGALRSFLERLHQRPTARHMDGLWAHLRPFAGEIYGSLLDVHNVDDFLRMLACLIERAGEQSQPEHRAAEVATRPASPRQTVKRLRAEVDQARGLLRTLTAWTRKNKEGVGFDHFAVYTTNMPQDERERPAAEGRLAEQFPRPVYSARWPMVKPWLRQKAKLHRRTVKAEFRERKLAALRLAVRGVPGEKAVPGLGDIVPGSREAETRLKRGLNNLITKDLAGPGWWRKQGRNHGRQVKGGGSRYCHKIIHGQTVRVMLCPPVDAADARPEHSEGPVEVPLHDLPEPADPHNLHRLVEIVSAINASALTSQEVLVLVAQRNRAHGQKDADLALLLGLTTSAFKTHLSNARKKISAQI
jgi:DNA-directed RNA polymerase specialized sigma24 family protein